MLCLGKPCVVLLCSGCCWAGGQSSKAMMISAPS